VATELPINFARSIWTGVQFWRWRQ